MAHVSKRLMCAVHTPMPCKPLALPWTQKALAWHTLQTSWMLAGKMSMLRAASMRTALAARLTASRCCLDTGRFAVPTSAGKPLLPLAGGCNVGATQIMPLQPRMMLTPVHWEGRQRYPHSTGLQGPTMPRGWSGRTYIPRVSSTLKCCFCRFTRLGETTTSCPPLSCEQQSGAVTHASVLGLDIQHGTR